MAILINKQTNVVIQGMTGKEGQNALKHMLDYGTKVSCGVTPGKGGQEVMSKPVFDTISEALKHDPTINTSVIYVPPAAAKDAALEAIHNHIKLVIVITEFVPIKDAAILKEEADKHNVTLIGPSSVGMISPELCKIGVMGGENTDKIYTKGPVGIISKSGGMCGETALILTQQGLGQSTVIGIGGDAIAGSTFVDLMLKFEKDPETKAIVMFGELGGTYEEQVAKAVKNKLIKKPIIAFIAGKFSQSLQSGVALGHAGAIIEGEKSMPDYKIKVLKEAGVKVAEYHDYIPQLVKEALQ